MSQRVPTGANRTVRGSASSAPDPPSVPAVAPVDRLISTSSRVVGKSLGEPLPPLHDRDRLLERRVEVEVVELLDATEPVGVDVHQRRPALQRGVHAGDDEGRRRDVTPHTQSGADPLGEGGLAGPEVTAEDDQVAGREHGGEPSAERARVIAGSRLDLHGQDLHQPDQRPVAVDLDVPEPLPEALRPRQLGTGQHAGARVTPLGGDQLGQPDHGAGDAAALRVGVHRDPAQAHQVAVRLQQQATDGTELGGRQHTAVRRPGPPRPSRPTRRAPTRAGRAPRGPRSSPGSRRRGRRPPRGRREQRWS